MIQRQLNDEILILSCSHRNTYGFEARWYMSDGKHFPFGRRDNCATFFFSRLGVGK